MVRAKMVAVLLGVAMGIGTAVADERVPFELAVQDAAAKVGQPAAVVATITPPDGIRFTSVYRHRIIDLSAENGEGVEFARPVVTGDVEDGKLVFEIQVTPTSPGPHPINGLMRVSFLNDNKTESKSIPLMATVTGEE